MADVANELGSFFDYIWQDTSGYVYLPRSQGEVFKQAMYKWPERREDVISYVLQSDAAGWDTYYGPVLYKEMGKITKENILGSHVLWVDFDGTAPSDFGETPTPTLRVQSSIKGHEHNYWLLDSLLSDVAVLEERNRALAYAHKADSGGWDAVQILRPVATTNSGIKRKSDRVRNPAKVTRISDFGDSVGLDDFAKVPSVKQTVSEIISRPENVPAWSEVIAFNPIPKELWNLFNESKENLTDRSGALFRLAALSAEAGLDDPSIYSLLDRADNRWEKYKGRRDRDKHLIDIINRVRLKHANNSDIYAIFEEEDSKETHVTYGFLDFLSAEFKFDWLIEGLLSVGGMGMLTGAPGAGKTQLSLQLAASVALGSDFLTWKNAVAESRKVLFLSLEMGGAHLLKFLTQIAGAYTEEEQKVLQENLIVAPVGEAVYFDSAAGQAFIQHLIGEVRPALIIIDSMGKITSKSSSDEIAIKAYNSFIQRAIRKQFNCAVVVIHHNRKADRETPNAQPTQEDVLGHTYVTGELDFAIALKALHAPRQVMLNVVKSRMAEIIRPFELTRTEHLTYVPTSSEGGLSANREPVIITRTKRDEPAIEDDVFGLD